MLSNTATPKYYGMFRDAVLAGRIPVCNEIGMEMNRIDKLIADPRYYYDDKAIDGYINFCNNELTLTDGSELELLDSFKLWAEQIFGWYYFETKTVWRPTEDGKGFYTTKNVKHRLTRKQYLIVGRGASKSMYASTIQDYYLNVDTSTTHQITVAPTLRQAEEVLSPIRTAIIRSRGPYFKFLTAGSIQNTTGSRMTRPHLASTKKGIQNFFTGSLLEARPMNIDTLQGLRCKVATVDEWLSGDIREDVIGAIEQGASKLQDYLIIATSSEGTVRNGVGDTMKMELMSILRGEYNAPHVSIWYYRLDDESEVANPELWVKANPNIGITVSYEAYQLDVERAEKVPATRNDILAKRFGIPSEGYTYFFTYEETVPFRKNPNAFCGMQCIMGADLSMGDDFCAFTFMFPMSGERFGIKTRSYISEDTMNKLQPALKQKYHDFINEGSLMVFPGTVLDVSAVYEDLTMFINSMDYDVMCMGYDPAYATEFVQYWVGEHGDRFITKVRQGYLTESVPLGELKKLAENRCLIFDEDLMSFCLGNAVALVDTNGNRKLYKRRNDEKIDNVAAMMDAFVSYKVNKDLFE